MAIPKSNISIYKDEKVEMIEINTNNKRIGKEFYHLRISVVHKKITITTALVQLLGNPETIIFANHPKNKKDWYIRAAKKDEPGLPVRNKEGLIKQVAGAALVRGLQQTLDIDIVENITLPVAKKPEMINDLEYYPIITAKLLLDANSK